MSIQYSKLFEPTLLGTSAATIYTAPSSPATVVIPNMQVVLTNNSTTTSYTATLYAVPLSGSASTTNVFVNARGLAPGESLEVNVPQLKAGDFLQGLASTANVINIQFLTGVIRA
jgi:hypothetical protein